jgi:hypothetical protein
MQTLIALVIYIVRGAIARTCTYSNAVTIAVSFPLATSETIASGDTSTQTGTTSFEQVYSAYNGKVRRPKARTIHDNVVCD